MRHVKTQDLSWMVFEQLQTLPHAIFTGRWNLAQHSPAEPPDLTQRHTRIQELFHLNHLVTLHQVHGRALLYVDGESPAQCYGADGLMTDQKGIGLLIQHADCQCALFYDPLHHALANVHAGWRGSTLNIYAATIAALHARFGTNPRDLLVSIGPSLGPNHAEFIHYERELPTDFLPFKDAQHRFNFWQISRMQLLSAGVLPEHIEIAGLCTVEHHELFYSYRGAGGTLIGANGTVCALN